MLSTEIIAEQLHLLNTYRQTLSICLEQRAMHGAATVPPSIVHTINDCRANIQRIKKVLRDSSVEIEDLPNDEDTGSVVRLLENIEAKLGSPTADDRRLALLAIGRYRLQQYLASVTSILLQDPSAELRERAAWTIDYLRNVDAISALIEALNDPSWGVRSSAGWALVHLGHPAIPAVQRVISGSQNKDAREMAKMVLERI